MVHAYDVPQVATRAPDGTGWTPLGTLGHVSDVTWSDTMPGGPKDLTCTLQISPSWRHPAMDPGRIVEVSYGASVIWEGRLDEPSPGEQGWTLTAKGAGTYGDFYRDIWTTWNATDAVDQAIGRGLRWRRGTFPGGLYLAEQQDSAASTLTDFLTLVTKPGAATWHVGRRNTLSVFPVPTVVTRILMCTAPAARSLAAYINVLYGRYQASGDNTDTGATATYGLASASNPASIAKHQRSEAFWDLTQAGTISSGTATGYLTTALSRYTAASWAGPLTARYGQYLTTRGTPVALACEQAGEVCQVMLADGPYGGEVGPVPPVVFPVGQVEYSSDDQTLAITPFLTVPADFSTLLDSLAMLLPKPPPVTE